MLNANPSANVTQLGNYDARFDGIFTHSVITASYTGTFDGAGYGVRNLTIIDADTSGQTAFFKTGAAGCVIKNFSVNGFISGSGQTGSAGIVASLAGTVQNCTNYATTTNSNTGSRNGGIAAATGATATITGCTNYGIIQAPAVSCYQGGIVGLNWGAVTNCINYASLSNTTTTGAWLGGICGANGSTGGTFSTAIVTGCTNYGAITGNTGVNNAGNYCGGIAGNLLDGQIISSGNNGVISGGNNVAGIAGRCENFTATGAKPTITNCYNAARITGTFGNVGGICGTLEYAVSNVWNTGTVTGSANVGGIAGSMLGTEFASTLDHAFNFASVIGSSTFNGGVVGNQAANTSMDQCYSLREVTASADAGAVVGNFSGTATNCYWCTDLSGMTRAAGNVVTPTGITGVTSATMLAGILTGFDVAWTRDSGGVIAAGYNYLTAIAAPAASAAPVATTTLLTGSGNYTIPANWNPNNNGLGAVGEGGNGSTLRSGGGGAFAANTNVSYASGLVVLYACGPGGSATKTTFNGTDLVADFGTSATPSVSGAGGTTTGSTGATKFVGGAGASSTGGGGGAGGGGAAGPSGAGKNGAQGAGNTTNTGGGGGGAANAGSVGVAGTSAGGGNGGAAQDSTAGGVGSSNTGTPGGNGSHGSGAGGGYGSQSAASAGGQGGAGIEFNGSSGTGGGGGGGGGDSAVLPTGGNGGAGGLYGAGGGAGGNGITTPGTGGAGAPGAIFVRYVPASA